MLMYIVSFKIYPFLRMKNKLFTFFINFLGKFNICGKFYTGFRLRFTLIVLKTNNLIIFLPHNFNTTKRMNGDINIGEYIYHIVKEKRYPITRFAEDIKCDRTNVYKIFQKPHIDTSLLLQISTTLDYDFFAPFSEYLAENKKL